MDVFWCRKHKFCPIDGQLKHCLAQNFHQGCIRLVQLLTTIPCQKKCIYKNGYIKTENIDFSNTKLSEVWYCEECDYCPQKEDLARCLNQRNRQGCIRLKKLQIVHPKTRTSDGDFRKKNKNLN